MIARQILNIARSNLRNPTAERFYRERINNRDSWIFPLVLVTIPRPMNYHSEEQREINLMGYDFTMYPSNYFQWAHYFELEDQVLNVLCNAAEDADVILDIGANIGLYSLAMAKHTKGRVYAFEPNPKTSRLAQNHIERNNVENVELHKIGLSDEVTTATLHNATDDLGKASLRAQSSSKNDVEVEISTIDVFLKKQKIKSVDLIKIDVEGLEMAVIRGGWKTIESQLPHILFEATPDWMNENDFETFERLRKLGYLAINIITQNFVFDLKRDCKGQQNLLLIHTSKLDALEKIFVQKDEEGNPVRRSRLSGLGPLSVRRWLSKLTVG